MEFLRFIFSSFWVWLGFVILVGTIGNSIVETVKACKRGRKVSVVKMGACVNTTIENATKDDAQNAVITAVCASGGEEQEHE